MLKKCTGDWGGVQISTTTQGIGVGLGGGAG